MAGYRVTQIEDYEPLVGRDNVERIRAKAPPVQRSAGGEVQFDLSWRRRGRDAFVDNLADE